MRIHGKEFNKEFESADIKLLKSNLRQHLPKSLELFNTKFIEKNIGALCEASIVGNLYITKKQSLLYEPNKSQYAPYFFKLYMFDILRKNIRIVNLYQNKPCTSIGMFAHYNYIGMPRAKFYELVKQIVTNDFRDHFYYSVIGKEKTDNLSMWDIHAYNFLKNQTELKEGELIDNLPLMELKNRLVIIQHMNEMSPELWNIFLNDGKFPFIFDTEWNFFDPQETGVRVIQVANSFVCFMILVDFDEIPADYLVDFLFNPKFTKLGFALNGDLKRINNWLTEHNMENLDRTFINTPDYMNDQGWIEGDPYSVGLSKLVTFHTFSNQKMFYKFKGILEFYEYKWQPHDLNPTLSHCLKRIDYASMDVLIGYYYLKCEKYPSNHLFNTNLRKGWNENTWKEEAKKSKEIKYSLLDIIYSDRSSLFTTKTRHFKMKVAYTKNFWKANENSSELTHSENNVILEPNQQQEETVDDQPIEQ
ncbi:predicted protein [Naegleria gruberi]|uniref:Predicted protein n=1 Tax=Naegleria gruberi TaxID=5762 RepID=D2V6M3_NAEGR|nr:uncharacterized protein NAEGRDRAFT_64492 [Naegleria gruberi]EFC47603.1 predicted protein [Naegleria gruberi]|eukprot:XP_002680347.1 predicted protein [Naegleria gruberi strain NEG-M]